MADHVETNFQNVLEDSLDRRSSGVLEEGQGRYGLSLRFRANGVSSPKSRITNPSTRQLLHINNIDIVHTDTAQSPD
jgi:hypothetical protein